MPCGRPSVGREQYVRIKLRKHTHALWIEVKRAHAFKSDDALAGHLLCSVSAATADFAAMEGCRFVYSI